MHAKACKCAQMQPMLFEFQACVRALSRVADFFCHIPSLILFFSPHFSTNLKSWHCATQTIHLLFPFFSNTAAALRFYENVLPEFLFAVKLSSSKYRCSLPAPLHLFGLAIRQGRHSHGAGPVLLFGRAQC